MLCRLFKELSLSFMKEDYLLERSAIVDKKVKCRQGEM